MERFPESWSDLDVILSHDWLTGMRGGERVLEILCRGFPDALLFTLIHDPGAISEVIKAHEIRTSWLQAVPGIMKHYRCLLPLFPSAVESMNVPQADLLISTSHCIAKGLRPGQGTRHMCYCFTPMRYAWAFHKEYFGENPFKAVISRPILSMLRAWDRKASARVDRFVAISRHVRKRIADFYGRESDVVYPPVDTEKWTPGENSQRDFDLIVSALVPYKRIDLAVSAYTKLGYPLKVVGTGNRAGALRSMAGSNIEFLGWKTDEEILGLYRACRMLVFPGEEDFGIVPLEAQACGRPVVAYARGGALESVKDGVSGVFFDEQTEESLLDSIEKCASTSWNPSAIRSHAETFGVGRFIRGLSESIRKCLVQRAAGE